MSVSNCLSEACAGSSLSRIGKALAALLTAPGAVIHKMMTSASLSQRASTARKNVTMRAALAPLHHCQAQCISQVSKPLPGVHQRRAAHQTRQSALRGQRLVTRMGLKIVENFTAEFELQPEAEEALHSLLGSEAFCKQVVHQCQLTEDVKVEFTGNLFQPVPWSVTSRKGMPPEFEKYADDPDFTVINIPPNFMFQAKVFKPSRLCAIYKHV